jgi:hypothetical protein
MREAAGALLSLWQSASINAGIRNLAKVANLAAGSMRTAQFYHCRCGCRRFSMPPLPLLNLQLPALTTLVIDRCFARDLTPLANASRLESLHLSYDCWAIMGVTFPHTMAALKKLRLMAALQVSFTWAFTLWPRPCQLRIVPGAFAISQLKVYLLLHLQFQLHLLLRCHLAGLDAPGCLHRPHKLGGVCSVGV